MVYKSKMWNIAFCAIGQAVATVPTTPESRKVLRLVHFPALQRSVLGKPMAGNMDVADDGISLTLGNNLGKIDGS